MKKVSQCFLIFNLLLMSQFALAASKWQDTQLIVVELDNELKPMDKKEITLEKPFNATNDIFKIEFNNFLDDNSIERKLNIQTDNASVLQRFTNVEQALNWAIQLKLNNGKTYYFMISKISLKK